MPFSLPPRGAAAQSFGTALRAALIALVAVVLLAGRAGAAGPSGLIDDTSYESPTYGYAVEWSQAWLVNKEATASDQGVDLLALATVGGELIVASLPSEWSLIDFAVSYADGLANTGLEQVEVVGRGERDGIAYAAITAESPDDGPLVAYVETRELAAAGPSGAPILTMTALVATDDAFGDTLASAIEEIALDGRSVFTAVVPEGEDAGNTQAGDDAQDGRDDGRTGDRNGRDRQLANDEDDEDDEDDDRPRRNTPPAEQKSVSYLTGVFALTA